MKSMIKKVFFICIPLFDVHNSNTAPRYSSGTIMVDLIQGSSIESTFTVSGISVGLCRSITEPSFMFIL